MFTDTDLEHLAHKVGLVRVPDSTPFSTGLAGVRGEFLQIGMARVLYAVRAARIPADALSAIASGDLSSAQAAASAVAARRSLEASTRTELPGWLAEMNAQRNISKPGYGGDPLGPRDLEQARVGKNGLIKSDAEVIESAGRANPGYTTAGAALGALAMAASILSAMAMAHTNDEFGYVDVFPYRIVTDPSKLPNGTRVKDFLTGELYTVSAGVLWCISCRSSRDPI